MNELAYRAHWKQDANARKLYHELRDLYGNDMPRDKLFTKAYLDHVITMDERHLLQDFITFDGM